MILFYADCVSVAASTRVGLVMNKRADMVVDVCEADSNNMVEIFLRFSQFKRCKLVDSSVMADVPEWKRVLEE